MAGRAQRAARQGEGPTRARDALAAERRRHADGEIEKDYVFDGPAGRRACSICSRGAASSSSTIHVRARASTAGRRRAAPAARCSPTRSATSRICTPAIPRSRWSPARRWRTSGVPAAHGWTCPGFPPPAPTSTGFRGHDRRGRDFGLSVFLRDGDSVYRTYFTTARGVEALGTVWTLLDLTPFGRQESWEDSPDGWPQTRPIWWRRHDEYDWKTLTRCPAAPAAP